VALAAVDFALVGDHAEVTVGRRHFALGDADNVALVLQAVADEFGDGEHLHAMLGAELDEVGDAGHGAVVLHDFADDAGGDESGHAGEVDGRFGLSRTDEDAAFAGAEWKDVAGAGEVVGGGNRVDGYLDGVGAVMRGDSCSHAFPGFDGFSESGAKARGILLCHGAEAEVVSAFFGQGETDETASVLGHEVDGFGRDELRGEGEVAFVFAVLVVDYDSHAPSFEFFEGAGDVSEWRLRNHVSIVCQWKEFPPAGN